MTSYYSQEELYQLGFQALGKSGDILISRKASIYGAEKISIGDHVRIDDFCILSGTITLGNYIHIAAYCGLFGGSAGIEMHDFSGLSSRCVIYAESDDYSGQALTNPTIPNEYRQITKGKVVLERHVLVGTGTSILPGVTLHEGCSVGSMSFINKSLDEWGLYVGIPCRKLKERSKRLLELEKQWIQSPLI